MDCSLRKNAKQCLYAERAGPVMLVLCGFSWGEIDWILPVLVRARQGLDPYIHVHFMRDDVLNEGYNNSDLLLLVNSNADAVTSPSSLRTSLPIWKQLEIYIHSLKFISSSVLFKIKSVIGLLLKRWTVEYTIEDALKDYIERRTGKRAVNFLFHDYSGVDVSRYYPVFPSAKVVVFPHSTYQYQWINKKLRKVAAANLKYETIKRDALFLVGHSGDVNYFRYLSSIKDIIAVGYPKLEDKWVLYLRRFLEKNGLRKIRTSSEMKTVLFLSMPKRRVLGNLSFEMFLESVVSTAHENHLNLVIKKHPRQEVGAIESVLGRMSGGRDVEWARKSVLTQALMSDLVITCPSSACMDGVAAGVPVIEYFNYQNQEWNAFITVNGQKTSIFRYQGMVLPADNERELKYLVSRLLSDTKFRDEVIKQQRESLRKVQVNEGRVLDDTLECIFGSQKSKTA